MNIGFIIAIIGLMLVISPLFLIILMLLNIDVFRIDAMIDRIIEEQTKEKKHG